MTQETTPTEPISDQNAQARLVLIQLQWLVTILLVTALLWLGNRQAELIKSVDERLTATEQLNQRINDLDDRLFAVSPAPPPKPSDRSPDNDWQLVHSQLTSANTLYKKGEYQATSELLEAVAWQLGNEQLHLAMPLKNALSQAIKDDLATLTTLQTNPDDWQLQIIKMQEIQAFLRTHISDDKTLDREQFVLANVNLLLSLAIGASNNHDKSATVQLLTEIQRQLDWLNKHGNAPTAQAERAYALDRQNQETTAPNERLESVEQAIFAVNELLANPPKSAPLTSIQILKR